MYMDDYKRWLAADLEDPALTAELQKIEGQDDEIKERFAVALKFGTAGLRGILGAGSNRMNIYVVRQATQGLANWVKTQGGKQLVAALGLDPVCQTLSGLTDNVDVHAVGTCTQNTAQTGSTELQSNSKALLDLVFLTFDLLQLFGQSGIFQLKTQPALVIIHVHMKSPILISF